jgi:hypothetical protein
MNAVPAVPTRAAAPALAALLTSCFLTTTSPTPTNPRGTVIVPNGASGVAIVHVEDASGDLLATASVRNLAAAGNVTLVAEPADFSQGIVATDQELQTLNAATTLPEVTDDVALSSLLSSGSPGTVLSVAVFADSTFSAVQMSGVSSFATTCFTGGLHVGQNQTLVAGAPAATAMLASPDGSLMAAWGSEGLVFWNITATTSPHAVQYSPTPPYPASTPVVTGRGAMAFDPTSSDTLLAGGPDGTLHAFTNLHTAPAHQSIDLPGKPAVASVAYAPGGQYAVVATTSGLFTVSVSAGVPAAAAAPSNPTYTGSDGSTYPLSGAQSLAITADGSYLVALTDQPSASAGTLVVMPIDASGTVGPVGLTQGGLLATAGADVLLVH